MLKSKTTSTFRMSTAYFFRMSGLTLFFLHCILTRKSIIISTHVFLIITVIAPLCSIKRISESVNGTAVILNLSLSSNPILEQKLLRNESKYTPILTKNRRNGLRISRKSRIILKQLNHLNNE